MLGVGLPHHIALLKIRFYLDFCPPQDGDDALEYLEWIVDLMRNRDEEGRYWLTELHINSTQGINPQKLARILRKLKGLFSAKSRHQPLCL